MLLIQVAKGLGNQRGPGARFVVNCWGTYDTVIYAGPPLFFWEGFELVFK